MQGAGGTALLTETRPIYSLKPVCRACIEGFSFFMPRFSGSRSNIDASGRFFCELSLLAKSDPNGAIFLSLYLALVYQNHSQSWV